MLTAIFTAKENAIQSWRDLMGPTKVSCFFTVILIFFSFLKNILKGHMGDKGFTDGQKFTIPIQISFQASCDIFYIVSKKMFSKDTYLKKFFFKSDGLTLLEDFLFRIQIGA